MNHEEEDIPIYEDEEETQAVTSKKTQEAK